MTRHTRLFQEENVERIFNPTRLYLDLGMPCFVYAEQSLCKDSRNPVLIECTIHGILPDYTKGRYEFEVHEKDTNKIWYVKLNQIQSVIKTLTT